MHTRLNKVISRNHRNKLLLLQGKKIINGGKCCCRGLLKKNDYCTTFVQTPTPVLSPRRRILPSSDFTSSSSQNHRMIHTTTTTTTTTKTKANSIRIQSRLYPCMYDNDDSDSNNYYEDDSFPLQQSSFRNRHQYIHRRRMHTTNNNTSTPSTSTSTPITSTRSLSSSATAQQQQQEHDYDDEIDMFASSCFTELLPSEYQNFYNDINTNQELNSLDLELGNESIWDESIGEKNDEEEYEYDNEYDNEEDFIIEEEEQQNRQPFDSPTTMRTTTTTTTTTFADQRQPEQIHSNQKQQQQQQHKKKKKTAIEMLRHFDPQEPPSGDDLEEVQLWLECAAQREASIKYQKLVDKARDRKSFDSMGLMHRYIVQWYQNLCDIIQSRQKEFLSNEDTRTAKWRYGPFLCSLDSSKMAVILSHESLSTALSSNGSNGRDGVPISKMAIAIGSAIETEVIFQRKMKEKFYYAAKSSNNNTIDDDDDDDNNDNDGGEDDDDEYEDDFGMEEAKGDNDDNAKEKSQTKGATTKMDKWKFTASHLKMFMDDLNRNNATGGGGKNNKQLTLRRAKQVMNTEDSWRPQDIAHIGAALLSIFIDSTSIKVDGKDEPVFRIEKRWLSHKGKMTSYVILNENLYNLFYEDKFLSWAATTTRHTPMVVPPSDWVGPQEGGYRWLQADLMRVHGSNFQKEALQQHGDFSTLFEGLNILGRTPWKINKDMLQVAQHCWDNNIAIGDIPPRTDFELPLEPIRPERISPELFADKENPETQAAMAANGVYRDQMKKLFRIRQKNMDLRSLRASATLKLDQAMKFQDFERIYFPYNIDFRGRAYPVPPHLSNVGSDLCRGMLMFAEKKPLGKRGLYWLKVHLANLAGMDKMSFDDRAKFVDDNMDKVRACVESPFHEDPWWMKFDDPFQGLATCSEILQAIDSGNPETYMSCLPVHMDGSCNGLQHYAALGLDTVGGKAVNLLKSDKPQDVYSGVMDEVKRRVAEEAARDVDFDTSNPDSLRKDQKKLLKNNRAAKLVNGLIDRGVVKRPVMTSVYGVTYIGARQQIQEKLEEKLEEQGHDIDEMAGEIFAASGYLASMTIDVMGDLFQGARKTQNWLAECARLIAKQGHPVAWISPTGVPAIQPYRQTRPRTVVTVLQTVTLADENDDLPVHRRRQTTAFPPNYVHSLDSSHMLLTALEMDRRGLSFSAVHDSFWTHACDIDEMNAALRSCFVDLYSQPLLSDLKNSWELRYPDVDFPELPELGDLDLEEVKSAKYFFQ